MELRFRSLNLGFNEWLDRNDLIEFYFEGRIQKQWVETR